RHRHGQVEEDGSGARGCRSAGDARRDLLPWPEDPRLRAAGAAALRSHPRRRGAGVTRAAETIASPEEILAFWRAAGPAKWFEREDAFDAEIRARFLATYEAAAAGRLDDWQTTPDGTLALLILLDQIPRNLFRAEARAFATDAAARAIGERAIARGIDQLFPVPERRFFYLPLMHSEN